MKKIFSFPLLLTVLLTTSMFCLAQDEEQSLPQKTPRYISEKGYWVVESNVKTPYHSIIHFYNNDNVLVYRENVDGVKINLDKTRTKMKLKKILEQSIVAWEKNHQRAVDQDWVARAFK